MSINKDFGGSGFTATPSIEWKFDGEGSVVGRRWHHRVSARKLGASLWQFDRLGFEFLSSTTTPKFAMEGVIEWDNGYSNSLGNARGSRSSVKLLENQGFPRLLVLYDRQTELDKAWKRIKRLEAEQAWSSTIIERCKNKLTEERGQRVSWTRSEQKRTCAIFENLKDRIKRERSNCKKMEILKSKLLSDIAEAKLSTRNFIRNSEKEKKAKELLNDMSYELAKEFEVNKGEIEAFKNHSIRVQEEVEQERKMLRMAEVWQEARTQMKLIGAMFIFEDKCCRMNKLIADLDKFLRQPKLTTNTNKLRYVGFSVIKDFLKSEAEGRSSDHCLSHDRACFASSVHSTDIEAKNFIEKIEEVHSGRSTLSESECSVSGISRKTYISNCDAKWKKNAHHESQNSKSKSDKTSSFLMKKSKKKCSSIGPRTLGSNEYTCKKLVRDGSRRLSNESMSSFVARISPRRPSTNEGALHRHDLVSRRHSLEPSNHHRVRAIKGQTEWPRGIQNHICF